VPVSQQQQIVKDLFGMVSKRSDGVCNFVEDASFGKGTKVVYRVYATLIFIFVVDQSESELGILDLIHVMVVPQRALLKLDRGNVCAGGGV
jgi:AP-3 complex subunit sigma